MIDLTPLRPTDNTPPAIAAALDRALATGRDALATIKRSGVQLERLKVQHAALIMSGQSSAEIDEALAESGRATEDALQISQLVDELRRELDKATAAMSASLALAEMADWVSENSEALVRGMYLLNGLSKALTVQPLVPTPPMPPTNVVPMTPRPGAA